MRATKEPAATGQWKRRNEKNFGDDSVVSINFLFLRENKI